MKNNKNKKSNVKRNKIGIKWNNNEFKIKIRRLRIKK
jgi:hypothetical protein